MDFGYPPSGRALNTPGDSLAASELSGSRSPTRLTARRDGVPANGWGPVWAAWFAAVVVPPDVAEHLNTDAMAAVIRNEAQASGKCSLPVARIAERANIGKAKARAAIRLAESLGLIAIEETPDRKRVIVNRGVMSRC